ncbi:MAG: ABC transporter permease [Acetobacteraceae bacterium]
MLRVGSPRVAAAANATPEDGFAQVRAARSRRSGRLLALLQSTTFLIGTAIVLFWVVDAVFWPAIVPQNPQALNPTATLAPPSAAHWFGTDDLGRDVLSRTLAGAASVLTVAPAATALGLLGGIVVGLIGGYYRGVVDDVLMRVVDALLAFPLIVIAVLVLAVLGPSVLNVILVIGFVFTPIVARTVRSAVLAEREREYVAAARLLGSSSVAIMVVEILPNITAPLAVEATIRFGYAVFTSATLAFLSLGVQQPSPDWGLTISLARANLETAPWIALFPAAALATLIVGINLAADGLRQVLQE